MAKTLNEVLATARKSLPTADSTRELLVQALEHLKDVKDTADSAAVIHTFNEEKDMDILKKEIKIGDFLVPIWTDQEEPEEVLIVLSNAQDSRDIHVIDFRFADDEILYGGINWLENATWEEISTQLQNVFPVESGTKLYLHRITVLGSGDVSALDLDIVSTDSQKVLTLSALATLIANSVSTKPRTSTDLYFNGIASFVGSGVVMNFLDGGTSKGIMITSFENYTVTPL